MNRVGHAFERTGVRVVLCAVLFGCLVALNDARMVDDALAATRPVRAASDGDAARSPATVEDAIARLDHVLEHATQDGRLALLRAEFETWRDPARQDPAVHERWLECAARDLPSRARIEHARFAFALSRGEANQALEHLERCLLLDPTHVEIARSALHDVWLQAYAGEHRERWVRLYAAYARAVVGGDPRRAGQVLLEWEALTQSRERPEWFPASPEAHLSAAYHDLVTRRPERSRAWLDELLPAPRDARVYTYLALVSLALSNVDEARVAARLAVERDPEQADHLIAVARHVGLLERCREVLRDVLPKEVP